TNSGRLSNRDYLVNELQSIFINNSIEYWLKNFEDVGVPCSPILNVGEAFNDAQSKDRGAIWTLDDGSFSVASAFRFLSATPALPGRGSPGLDEHRSEILRDWLP
ncbi:MAG: CoA transferase, partial [Candidatus Thermoplasmatota archaeon]|nr:CoA transferase [Candidatus Thermoplasmatota archaeon]